MNTHRVVIQDVNNNIWLIATGDKQTCHRALDNWINNHPLQPLQTGYVLEVVKAIPGPPMDYGMPLSGKSVKQRQPFDRPLIKVLKSFLVKCEVKVSQHERIYLEDVPDLFNEGRVTVLDAKRPPLSTREYTSDGESV